MVIVKCLALIIFFISCASHSFLVNHTALFVHHTALDNVKNYLLTYQYYFLFCTFLNSLPKMSESVFSSLNYDMHHKNRGIAVIISNTNFQRKTGIQKPERNNLSGRPEHGKNSADALRMRDLLQTLGFKDIQSYNDVTADQMRGILHEGKQMFIIQLNVKFTR